MLQAEQELSDVFSGIDAIEAENQWKVLHSFQQEGVAQRHFAPTTGYGYDDIGRDTLERLFARSLDAEDALVRPQIVNGTHALYLTLAGLLRPGEMLLCITGKPYDTLHKAIGAQGEAGPGSLAEFGIHYREIRLVDDAIDLPRVLEALQDKSVRVVYAQRSRGYAWREAIRSVRILQVFAESNVHALTSSIAVITDTVEFTCSMEPTQSARIS